jgi:hypothetical protein
MPEIRITLNVRAAFVEEKHRELIVDTVREAAQHVLTNIVWLTPSSNKIQPSVTMAVEERGVEKRNIDIARQMADTLPDNYEDPFA